MSMQAGQAMFPNVIVDRAALAQLLAERQSAGERAVFTNGIFDLLHLGHIQYLQRARALGDLLIVGVNSDASTRRLKGPRRPLTPQDERAQTLAALTAVDYVTIFDEDTTEATLQALRPAICVKGADYAVTTEDGQGQSRDYQIGADDLRRLLTGQAPRDLALAGLRGLAKRLGAEAEVIASYGGSLALLAYLPGHSTSELIARILVRYAPADASDALKAPPSN